MPGRTNYFIGAHPRYWLTDVPQYARVEYGSIYPGINLAFHGERRQLEFDFIVSPGAEPASIQLRFTGPKNVRLDATGDLILSSSAGNLRLHKPIAYQEQDGARQAVDARFTLRRGTDVGFAVGEYDPSRELIIDPSLSYSTYLGGSGEDEAMGIAVDAAGNAYVTGTTNSLNFPGGPTGGAQGFDAFVSKLNASGTGLVYTTFLGGSGDDIGSAISLDSGGNAYIGGITTSADFSVTPGVLQSGLGGPQDGFVARLNANGSLAYATYLGGTDVDTCLAIAVDHSGNAYVGGETLSNNFPGASFSVIQPTNRDGHDGFVAKLGPGGVSLVYSTYLGGTAADLVTGLALDSGNNVYVAGTTLSPDFPATPGAYQTRCGSDGNCNGGFDDGFVTAIKADGASLLYSTFLGGSGTDDALAIAADEDGGVYLTGQTNSVNFPTSHANQGVVSGGYDAFITRLDASGAKLVFSTYSGGAEDDIATGVALDAFKDAYITGRTLSRDFPTLAAFQGSNGGLAGSADAFVTELSNTGFLVYSSYLGGSGNENSFSGNAALSALGGVAVDSGSRIYVAGNTSSGTGFPIAANAVQANHAGGLADAFVARLAAAPADFSISASPESITVNSGQTASYTVTASSVNSPFGNAVSLSCSGLPAFAACAFSPASVVPGTLSANSALAVSTGVAITQLNLHGESLYAAMLPLCGLLLAGSLACRRSIKKKIAAFLFAGTLIWQIPLLSSCGSSRDGGAGGSGVTTPPGNYNITVTGTAGSTSHSTTVTLTVR